jgi:hypothetical protein
VWPCALSGRLSIFGLVGFYPANYLIDRGLLSRRLAPFFSRTYAVLAQVSPGYSPPRGRYPRVTHQYATLLRIAPFLVRLACVKRAASVDSEPGSNSRLILLKNRIQPYRLNSSSLDKLKLSDVVTRNIQSVVKELSRPRHEPGSTPIDSAPTGLERRSNNQCFHRPSEFRSNCQRLYFRDSRPLAAFATIARSSSLPSYLADLYY